VILVENIHNGETFVIKVCHYLLKISKKEINGYMERKNYLFTPPASDNNCMLQHHKMLNLIEKSI